MYMYIHTHTCGLLHVDDAGHDDLVEGDVLRHDVEEVALIMC